jgi:O-antigen ligase
MGHLGLAFWLFASTSLSTKLIHKIMVHVGILFLVAGLLVGGKWSGTILESNNYAIIAVAVFILSLDSRTLVPMVLAPIAIVFAESRSALLSMVVLVKYLPKKILFLILVVTLGFLIWFSWLRGSGGRGELWGQSLVLWKQHPWLGIGFDNFQTAFSALMQGKGLQWVNYDQPHNLILWLLVSTGSLGLASFIGWITTIFLSAKRTIWLKIALAILIFGQFQPFSVSTWVYLFIVLACSL